MPNIFDKKKFLKTQNTQDAFQKKSEKIKLKCMYEKM